MKDTRRLAHGPPRGRTTRHRLIAGCAGTAVLVAVIAIALWAASRVQADELDARERAVVNAIDRRETADDPQAARAFIDGNLDVLLSPAVADAADPDAYNGLFVAALHAGGPPDGLLDRIAATVATEGEIHNPALARVLADAVAENMAWADERISAPFMYQAGEVPRDVEAEYLALHDFLRETMRDPDAAGRIREGLHHYGSTETRAAPQSGQARRLRLKQIGRLQRFLFETQRNAERGKSDDELDTDDLAAAQEREEPRRIEDTANRAVWLVTDLYDSDTPAGTSLRTSAHGQPFVDGTGALKSDMSPSELRAFREWASAQTGTDDDRGPIWSDNNALHAGGAEIVTPEHGIHITGRR